MSSVLVGRFAGLMLVALLCVACASPSTLPTPMPSVPTAPAATATPTLRQAILLTTIGEVTIQRSTWTKMAPTTGFTVLFEGDQIHVAPGAKARLLCSDFKTVYEPQPGRVQGVTAACPTEAVPLMIGGQRALPVRSPTPDSLPYVTSPRFTRLLDANPELSWNPVTTVTTYTVSLRDPNSTNNQAFWVRTVPDTRVRYDGKPLMPEKRYWVEVTDGTATERSEFSIASPATQRALEEQIAMIEQKLPDPLERAVAVALLYSSEGLYADAMNVLDPVTDAAPGVLALQGQLLLAMKWDNRAYATYEILRQRADIDSDPALLVEATVWAGRFLPRAPNISSEKYAADKKKLLVQASEIVRSELGDKGYAATLEQEQP